jgi:uncharacterized protein (UPF0179 family)
MLQLLQGHQMRPTTAENPPLTDPLDASHFDANCHTTSLLDTDRCNAARLDTVLCNADPHSVCHHNTDLRTDSLRGADLHNANHCNAEISELLLEGILSEGDNQAMETSVGDFKASKTGEENCSTREKRSPVKMKSADAECFARPQSERNQCWAQWLLPTGQRRSRELSCVELASSIP